MTSRKKFRDNANNLISANRPKHIKIIEKIPGEAKITGSFRKSINLYFKKSKAKKDKWEKKYEITK